MGRPRIQRHCRHCGKPCTRRGRYAGGWTCIDCAVGRSAEAQRQINARQGEYYERWIAGMAESVDRARAKLAEQAKDAESASTG